MYATHSAINFKSGSNIVEVPKRNKLIRVKELHYYTFLFSHEERSVYSISLSNQDPKLRNLELILEDYVEIVDFYTLPVGDPVRQKIALECPLDSKQGELGSNNDDNLSNVGEGLGNIFGGISALIPVDKMNK